MSYISASAAMSAIMTQVKTPTLLTSQPIAGDISTSDGVRAAVIIVAAAAIIGAIHYGRHFIIRRLEVDAHYVELARRFLITLVLGVATLYVLQALNVRVTPLLGGLGVSSIIVALALQSFFGNLVGSVLLNGSRSFRPGDQLDTNGVSGTVVDITSRAVEIVDFDGVTNFVPNLKVLAEPMRNRTAENIRRTVLNFQVSYDTDLRFTQRTLQQAIREIDGITDIPTAEILVYGFADSGINMKALFWHPSEELTAQYVTSEVLITIRETLAEHNISIPFPHIVLKQPGPSTPEPSATPKRSS